MAFVGMLSQIKLLFGPLVIHLVWYILKQLFTSVSGKWWIFTSTLVGNKLLLSITYSMLHPLPLVTQTIKIYTTCYI